MFKLKFEINNMKKISKKGMMDDFFDIMFTVIAAFFMLLFVGGVLNGNISNSLEESAKNSLAVQESQQFSNFLISTVNYEEKDWLVQDLMLTVLEKTPQDLTLFKQILSKQIEKYFPETASCFYRFRFDQNNNYLEEYSYFKFGKSNNCPVFSLTYYFPGEEYTLRLTMGGANG